MNNKPMKVNESNKQYGEFRSSTAGNAPDAGNFSDEAEEIFVGRDKELFVNNYGGVGYTRR